MLDVTLKFLENPDVCRVSGRNILIAIFHVLRVLCTSGWKQTKRKSLHLHDSAIKILVVATKLLDASAKLEYFQQATASQFPLLDAADAYQNAGEFEDLLHAMLSYLATMDSTLFGSKGENSARPYCLFITGLAEKFPAFLHRHLSYIVPFLNLDVSC